MAARIQGRDGGQGCAAARGSSSKEAGARECSTAACLASLQGAGCSRRAQSPHPHISSHISSHISPHFAHTLRRTLVDDTHWSPPAAAPPAPAPAPPPPPVPSPPPSPCACSRAATVKTSLLRRTWEQVVQGKSSSCAPAPSCPAMHCGQKKSREGGVFREGWQGRKHNSGTENIQVVVQE